MYTGAPLLIFWFAVWALRRLMGDEVNPASDPATLIQQGEEQLHAGNYQGAAERFARLVKVSKKKHGEESLEHGMALRRLGQVYAWWQKFDIAEPLYLQSLGIEEKELGPKSQDLVPTLKDLTYIAERQGKYDVAIERLKRAILILAPGGEFRRRAIDEYTSLARLQRDSGDSDAAAATLREIIYVF